MGLWEGVLIGIGIGIFVSYLTSRLRRMCRRFTQCSATIESLGIWSNDRPIWKWYAKVKISIPKVRGFFADPMQDMLVGEVIIDEEGRGRSGGFRNAQWIDCQTGDVFGQLEIPKNRGGKLLLLSQLIPDNKVYILGRTGTPLNKCKYVLRVKIRRLSDDEIVYEKNFDINITETGVETEMP